MNSIFAFLFSSSPFFSVTLAEGLVLLGLVVWVVRFYRQRVAEIPVFSLPLLAFAISSLTSAFLSLDPSVSIKDTKELFLYLIPLIVVILDKKWLKKGVVMGGGIAALAGALRDIFIKQERLTGFVGHYMTEGGLMMMAFVFLIALILFEGPSPIYLTSFVFVSVALALTLTRSAWVGAFVGSLYLFYKKKRVFALIFALSALVLVLLSPAKIRQRALSIFSRNNPTNVERINMWGVGLRMAKLRPFFGIGQNMASRIYPAMNKKGLAPAEIPHLHNTYLQILVERGGVGLTLFFLFVLAAFKSLLRRVPRVEAIAALGVLIAFLTAGFFEYNFGDSEVKILFLILISLPFVRDKEEINDKNP